MTADPDAIPVTCGWIAGDVLPPATEMLVGETRTLLLSLLAIVTVKPPAGAGVDNVTGKAADWLGATVMPAGRLMVPGPATVTVKVVSA